MSSPELRLADSVGNIWVWVTSNSGERKELSTEVAKIVINEGIDHYHIYGYIDFFDTIGIRSELPLIGQEKIELSWLKLDRTILHEMYISSVEMVTEVNKVSVVRCYITTKCELLSEIRSFSKSYKGPISETIDEIHRDKLDRPLDVKESSNGAFAYIVPSKKPYEAIDHLLPRAYTADGAPLFLYQTVIDDYLKLESLNTIQAKAAVTEYFFSPVAHNKRTAFETMTDEKNVNKIYTLEKVKTLQFQDMLSSGVIRASQSKYDIGKKTLESATFDYSTINIGQGSWYNRYDIEGRPVDKERGKDMKTMCANSMAHNGNIFNLSTENIDRPMISTARYNERNAIELRVEMNSHPDLAAGSKIKVYIPNVNPDLSNDDVWDTMYTGDYIISHLVHIVEFERYRVAAVLIKNRIG